MPKQLSMEKLLSLLVDYETTPAEQDRSAMSAEILKELIAKQEAAHHDVAGCASMVELLKNSATVVMAVQQLMELNILHLRFDPAIDKNDEAVQQQLVLLVSSMAELRKVPQVMKDAAQALNYLSEVGLGLAEGIAEEKEEEGQVLYVADWSSDDDDEDVLEGTGSDEVN